jgi:hypothetical protein
MQVDEKLGGCFLGAQKFRRCNASKDGTWEENRPAAPVQAYKKQDLSLRDENDRVSFTVP